MKALVDGVLVSVLPGSDAALPGGVDGVFETVRVARGAPEFWSEHWDRFSAGCEWLGLEEPVASNALRALAMSLIAENKIERGVLRYAAWRETDPVASGEPGRPASGEPGRTAWRVEAMHPRATMDKGSLSLTLGPVLPPGGPERRFKHLRREAWLEALQRARADGFDEAVLRDSGDRIVEVCVGNVFFEVGGVLHTPGPGSGALPGIFQGKVIAAARRAGIEVRERDCFVGELSEAREILISNSLVGLVPAHEFNARELTCDGPLLTKIRRSLDRNV